MQTMTMAKSGWDSVMAAFLKKASPATFFNLRDALFDGDDAVGIQGDGINSFVHQKF